jgi:hypothetical protein
LPIYDFRLPIADLAIPGVGKERVAGRYRIGCGAAWVEQHSRRREQHKEDTSDSHQAKDTLPPESGMECHGDVLLSEYYNAKYHLSQV